MRVLSSSVRCREGRNLLLRSAVPEDAQVMLQYLQTLFHESYQNMNWPKDHFDHFPLEMEQKRIGDLLVSERSFMIPAFDGDMIVGNISITAGATPFARFNGSLGMGVVKAYWRVGLGEALIRKALDEATRAGLHRVHLAVRAFNHGAIGLYEKVGFQRFGTSHQSAFIDGQWHDEHHYEIFLASRSS